MLAVPMHTENFLLWIDIPQLDCLILAAGSQIYAVRRKSDKINNTSMPSQLHQLLVRGNIPHNYRLIIAARS